MKINQKRPDFGHFKNRYLGRVEDPEGESSKEVTWREKSCDRTQRESCHGYSKQKRFRHLGSIQWNYLCHIWTAIKLCKDFEALCEMLSEFSSGHICACYSKLGQFHLDGANLQMQTYLMHQKWPYFMAVVFQPNWVDSIGPWIELTGQTGSRMLPLTWQSTSRTGRSRPQPISAFPAPGPSRPSSGPDLPRVFVELVGMLKRNSRPPRPSWCPTRSRTLSPRPDSIYESIFLAFLSIRISSSFHRRPIRFGWICKVVSF